MTWSRFDDLYDEHEKVEQAWETERATIGLHVMATTACNRWLSDGVIRPGWIKHKLPNGRERARVLTAMVAAELFDVLPAGETRAVADDDGHAIVLGPFDEDRYVVHDFLDRHDSSVQVKDRRAQDAARKKEARRKKSGRSPNGVQPESGRTPNGLPAESDGSPSRARARGSAGARPRPDPTRPDPQTPPAPQRGEWASPPTAPNGKRAREREHYDTEVAAYAAWLLPDDDEPARTQAVQVALGWLPGHVEGELTNDHVVRYVRQHCLGARVVELNERAAEAA